MNAAPLVQPGAFAGDAMAVAAPGRAAAGVRPAVDAPPAGTREAGADAATPVVLDPLLAAMPAPLFGDLMRGVGMPADAAAGEDTAEVEEVPVVVATAGGVVDGFAGAALARSFVPVGFASHAPSAATGGEPLVLAVRPGGAATDPAAAPVGAVRAATAEIPRVVVTSPDAASVAPRAAEPLPGALERLASVERAAASDRSAPSPVPIAASTFAAALAATDLAARDAAPLKLANGPASQWREPLLQALGERIQVEIGRGGERAVIRLDPPMMGRVEIVIRHDGGALQVHLTATHGEVLRQLQGIGETLRQDLVQRHFGDVSVAVFDASQDDGGRARRQRGDDAEREPGRALGGDATRAFALDSDRE